MSEEIKEVVEDAEVIIETKKKGPVAWVKEKVAKVPAAVKYVAAGVAGAAVVTGAGAAIGTFLNRSSNQGDGSYGQMTIEDFGTTDSVESGFETTEEA